MTRPAEQLHHFSDSDGTLVVRTNLQPNNEYTAIDDRNYDGPGSPMGFGCSIIEAIADLFEKLPRAASEREERDRMADRFDHQRDYRKHGAA